MPKYGIHHIVMAECINKLTNLGRDGNSQARNLAQLLNDNRPYAMLGAIGPDLFFWGPDYDLVKTFLDFYKQWEKVVEPFREIHEIVEDIKKRIKDFVDLCVRNLSLGTPHIARNIIPISIG